MAATLDQIIDALLDNADFEETSSTTKAAAFVTAAKRYLILMPANASDSGTSQAMNPAQVERMMQRAQAMIAAATPNAGGGSVRYFGFTQGRR